MRAFSSKIEATTFAYLIGLFAVLCFPSFASASLADGLMGHWTFDGKDTVWTSASAATTLDRSGNGNTGTLTNMTRAASPVVGKLGQAMDFGGGGSGDYIDIVSAASLNDIENQGGGGMTIVAWINPRSDGEWSNGSIVSKSGNPITSNGKWRFYFQDGGLAFAKGYSTTVLDVTGAGTHTYNKWQHVAMAWDGSAAAANVDFYIDGAAVIPTGLVQDGEGTKNSDASWNLTLGANFIFDGKIDDVRIYNRVLSPEEILKLYRQGGAKLGASSPRTPANGSGINSGLIGHWTFDGKDTRWSGATTGTTSDVSGYGNDGALTNMYRSTSTARGKLGQAVQFSGTGPASVIISDSPTFTNIKSISGWYKIATSANMSLPFINHRSGDNNRIDIFMGSDIYCTFSNGSAYNTGSYEVGFNDRKWHFVVCAWDGENVYTYYDGRLVKTEAFSGSLPDISASISIGRRNSEYFNGLIDDIKIYNRIPSAEEVGKLYRQGGAKLGVTPTTPTASTSATGINAGLVGHWTFDGKDTVWTSASAATTLDRSGSGNTGTLSNMSRANASVAGKLGQALRFVTANSQQIATANTSPYTGTVLTLSLWAKRANSLTTEQALYWSDIGYAFVNNRICFEDFWGGRMLPLEEFCSSQSYTDSAWHHYVFIADGTNLLIYRDNMLVMSTLGTIISSGAKNVPVIAGSNSRYFNGTIDDVRIYNRVLSAFEIGQIYRLGQSRIR
jgi:hypothetical protein